MSIRFLLLVLVDIWPVGCCGMLAISRYNQKQNSFLHYSILHKILSTSKLLMKVLNMTKLGLFGILIVVRSGLWVMNSV
jgi:hypothetical protein